MSDYDSEGSIKLAWGGEIRFPAYDDWRNVLCDYVRVIDAQGKEVAYWNSEEFTEEAGLVLGAFMGLAQNGPRR
jgi:hypothetical protein